MIRSDLPVPDADAQQASAALQTRALDFAASLKNDAAIITHAGVMRVLAGHWRQLPVSDWSALEFAFGELLRFTLR
jgi:broad specificity phosphatase PhoE